MKTPNFRKQSGLFLFSEFHARRMASPVEKQEYPQALPLSPLSATICSLSPLQ
jgi:hypothetical protein